MNTYRTPTAKQVDNATKLGELAAINHELHNTTNPDELGRLMRAKVLLCMILERQGVDTIEHAHKWTY